MFPSISHQNTLRYPTCGVQARHRKRFAWINISLPSVQTCGTTCLHHLRQHYLNPDINRSWEYIWIDAICINQTDVGERNQQVQAINTIFSNATVVTAWLGLQQNPRYLIWREEAIVTMENED